MAIPAVSVALSKFNDEIFRSPPCEVDERVEDLVIELTWMQCFLVDGEQTPEGRARTAVWSPAIERLAVYAQDLHSGFVSPAVKILGIEKLTKKLATLREKLLPFVTTHVGGPSYVAEVPDPLPAVQLSNEIKIAAWGGPGGQKWDHKGTIKHIVIVHGLIIDSITLTTVKPDGDAAVATKFGGGGGDTIVQVDIDAPMEYLTGISGTYGIFNSLLVITSLKLYTNITQHGPFGRENGDSFSCILEDGKIVGLHGSSGIYLDSIGVYTAPK